MSRIGAEIFGSHKVRIQNFKARSQALLAVCQYIIETETPLSKLKTFPNSKAIYSVTLALIIIFPNL